MMEQFFFTNRKVIIKKGREFVDDRNTAGASTDLRFGYLNLEKESTTLIKDLKVDVVGTDEEHFRHLNYSGKKRRGSSEWLHRIFDEMHQDKEKNDTLVYIHGFNCGFKSFVCDMQHFYGTYVQNNDSNIARIVGFTWPSNDKLTQYRQDKADAIYAGYAFARGWEKLMQFFTEVVGIDNRCGKNIHLICHSMGNLVFEQLIATVLSNGGIKYGQVFKEIILVAPDVQHDAFEKENPLYHINDFCERAHVYIHRGDEALRISKYTKNFESRLGKNGPVNPFSIPGNVSIVDCSKIRDQNNSLEKFVDHWYYKKSIAVIEDIGNVLIGDREFKKRSYDPGQNRFYLH